MSGKFCSDWRAFHDDIVAMFSSGAPCFLSRIGGSDTDALIDYLKVKQSGGQGFDLHIARHLPICERYNGFYDLGEGKVKSYIRYLNNLHACYMSAKFATFVHSHFLSIYFRDQIDPQFITNDIPNMETLSAFVESIVTRPEFIKGYPYNFIEGIIKNPFTLFQAFTKILAQRKVLVVSPFSESISVNFVNRRSFFKNGYMYPDFELCVVDTPITYGGMSQAMYPHRDWFETVDALKSKIRMQEFDIALLSCGSYAMMLGEFIQNELNKSAIYVGGVLQLFFGIMGRRYVNSYFLSQINSQEFIAPIERQRYLDMIPTSDTTAREAFGAYF